MILAPASIVVENLSVFAAIARSWKLTNGNFWRTFGTYLLSQFIVGAISGIVSVPVALVIGILSRLINPNPNPRDAIAILIVTQVISYLISALIGAVTLAFQTGVLALIYVDLRIRKEGFDLELLASLETTPDGAGLEIPGSRQYQPPPGRGWVSQ
ncbi:glycerophosphoryl diester phosphodiesterase membrane domain-containing protein [Renibacterium salmoninarum]|uniref:glycerophosphoryl diester phosphodiesterase membrane domain-containing protein n=1 Tax=Renibacterium salmoninarum TaxID=1646 RepID=UPI001F2CB549|nr:glycerophosphoryl diester phosphodiesterase membrane domain-containing protein [Renibacterium salmoninarum]